VHARTLAHYRWAKIRCLSKTQRRAQRENPVKSFHDYRIQFFGTRSRKKLDPNEWKRVKEICTKPWPRRFPMFWLHDILGLWTLRRGSGVRQKVGELR